MKCISIRQPWAWLIFHGKPVENRTWASKYRGPLLIHAAKAIDVDGWRWLCQFMPEVRNKILALDERDMQHSAIIGQVNMTDCVTHHPSPYFFGPYGHVYEDAALYKTPIPYKGTQRIFNVPQEALIIDAKCPACGELLVYPRGDSPYCEECLWPDEVLPEQIDEP